MSGILEQIHSGIQQVLQNQSIILQAIQSQAAQPAPVQPAPVQPAPVQPAAPVNAFGGLSLGGPAPTPVQPAPPANVTSDQIMALITPYLDNAAIKDALSGAMKSVGVNALPEARPDQFPALYAAFQQVIAQHGNTAAAAPAAAASII